MENWGKNIEVIGVLFRFNTSRDRTLKTEVKMKNGDFYQIEKSLDLMGIELLIFIFRVSLNA